MDKIDDLFRTLHDNAEPSGAEVRTSLVLLNFISENTTLRIKKFPDSHGFMAIHREGEGLPTIAVRADFDGLPCGDSYAHLCGHDGHSTALCRLALEIEGKRYGKNIILLFQPAEETGEGAEKCLPHLLSERPDMIIGSHNLPGFEKGKIYTRPSTFACASEGMSFELTGKAAHAAYPESGKNPARALSELLEAVTTPPSETRGMVLSTVVGVRMGDENYGISPANASLFVTLRGEYKDELDRLSESCFDLSRLVSEKYSVDVKVKLHDIFPSTENDIKLTEKFMRLTDSILLENPMRWSEDFGWYTMKIPGVFFGVGAGVSHPPLHSVEYVYPTEIIEPTVEAYMRMING